MHQWTIFAQYYVVDYVAANSPYFSLLSQHSNTLLPSFYIHTFSSFCFMRVHETLSSYSSWMQLNKSESFHWFQVDMNFMKKIPPGAEASNVLVGEVDFLEKPIIAFVRLSPAVLITGLTEVPVPTRYCDNIEFNNIMIKTQKSGQCIILYLQFKGNWQINS